MQKIQKTDDEWRNVLSHEQFRVARKGGTERAFSGQYHDNKDGGVYRCICCNTELFQSTEKYDSGSGWPSFWQPVNDDAIEQLVDNSHGMQRVEVRCGQCEAHLGHVFTDGPQPTGQRYCINSMSLDFEPKDIEQGRFFYQLRRQLWNFSTHSNSFLGECARFQLPATYLFDSASVG